MNFDQFIEIITDNNESDIVTNTIQDVFKLIHSYVQKHGNIALSCGAEWMYQDDDGQVDALSLVGDILNRLNLFAEDIDDDDDEYL